MMRFTINKVKKQKSLKEGLSFSNVVYLEGAFDPSI